MNLELDGHICEIQLLLKDLLELKDAQTPVYVLARSLGIVGDISGGIP